MTNLTDLTIDSLSIGGQDLPAPSAQALVNNGAITVKHGVCSLNKGSAIAATLAAPTAVTDDYKRLTVVCLTAQAHTVTVAEGFGNPLTGCVVEGEDVCTFSGVAGDCIDLEAFNGAWYVTGGHQYTIA